MTDSRQLDPANLPFDEHMEKTILGAMLIAPESIVDVMARLDAADFSMSSHQMIYRRMVAMAQAKAHIDQQTLRAELVRHRELDAVGGLPYILDLDAGIPRRYDVSSYVARVKELSRKRALILAQQSGVDDAFDPAEDARAIAERQIERLRNIMDDSEDGGYEALGDLLDRQGTPEQVFEKLEATNGIHLGFAQLHEMTGGPKPGELWIVAARPSMGKTAWMVNAVRHCAMLGKHTGVETLEQGKLAIYRRMLSSWSHVDLKAIQRGTVSESDKLVLLERQAALYALPLYLDDRPGQTVTRIRSKAAQQQRKVGLDILFIDQLSKVSGADLYQRGMDKRLLIGEQTTALKKMAQELQIPVVVFNQISRESTKRTDATPALSDLKESGNIEEDADVVILLHRPEYYDKTDDSLKGKAQMIVAKNRDGETGTCHCSYQGRIMKWQDSEDPADAQGSIPISAYSDEAYYSTYAAPY